MMPNALFQAACHYGPKVVRKAVGIPLAAGIAVVSGINSVRAYHNLVETENGSIGKAQAELDRWSLMSREMGSSLCSLIEAPRPDSVTAFNHIAVVESTLDYCTDQRAADIKEAVTPMREKLYGINHDPQDGLARSTPLYKSLVLDMCGIQQQVKQVGLEFFVDVNKRKLKRNMKRNRVVGYGTLAFFSYLTGVKELMRK